MELVHIRTVCLLLLLMFSFPVWAQSDNTSNPPLTVTVGVNHSPPYRIVSSEKQSGLYLDIFNELAGRLRVF